MKRIKNYILIVSCLVLSAMVFGQENNSDLSTGLTRKNSVDVTVGGTGLGLSTNYSRIIAVKSNYFINASVGIGSIPIEGGTTVPHQLTFNFGKKSSFLELGLGGTYWTGKSNASGYTERDNSYNISPIIGWRKNFKSNIVFRTFASPIIHVSGVHFVNQYAVFPYMGISLGYTF